MKLLPMLLCISLPCHILFTHAVQLLGLGQLWLHYILLIEKNTTRKEWTNWHIKEYWIENWHTLTHLMGMLNGVSRAAMGVHWDWVVHPCFVSSWTLVESWCISPMFIHCQHGKGSSMSPMGFLTEIDTKLNIISLLVSMTAGKLTEPNA